MRKLFSALVLVFVLSGLQAQDEVVQWTAELNEDKTAVVITADMSDEWVIYSQHTADDGPIPTTIEFEASEAYVLEGEVEEKSKAITKFSEMFEVEVIKFKEEAIFEQKLKLNQTNGKIAINVTFMTCDSKRCLPPRTVPLELNF